MYSILIVDDEEIILNGIRDTIAASELPLKSIQTANSASMALEMMEKQPFDLILSDIRMPDMDGLEMGERAKQIWPETRIIFLTGYQDFEYARKALRLNSDDFLVKPVQDEKLLAAISRIIEKMDRLWMERFDMRHVEVTGEEENRIQKGQKVCVFLIDYDIQSCRLGQETLHDSLCNMLEKLFSRYCTYFQFRKKAHYIMAILQPDIKADLWERICQKILEEIQSFFLEQLDIEMSIGFSGMLEAAESEKIFGNMQELCCRYGEYGVLFQYAEDVCSEARGSENYAVQAIQEYISQNPEKDLSLGALSEKFRINPSYLSRIFHKETGTAISEFITTVRLVKAKALLIETDFRIYEVAKLSGFETPGYFTKVFNKVEKISPKNYRILHEKSK